MQFNTTIIAQSTSIGESSVGIIKISGSKTKKILLSITKKKIIARYATFSKIYLNNKNIDNGIIIWFEAPKSFTGEDMLELHLHGNQKLISYCINVLIKNFDLNYAEPGEFTKRAFLNKKIDLLQAELTNSLIKSENINVYKKILKNFNGLLSKKLLEINNCFKKIYIDLETLINFCEQEIIEKKNILFQINIVLILFKNILKNINLTSEKNDLVIGLIGKPNVGKSTLFNQLIGKNKSIITNIPGTTRDLIEETINIFEQNIKIIDCAGIRKTNNLIEKEGINRSLSIINKCDIIIYISDNIDINNIFNEELFIQIKKKKKLIIIIKNKIDKLSEKNSCLIINNIKIISLSSKYKWSKDYLFNNIKDLILKKKNQQNILISNRVLINLIEIFNLTLKVKKNFLILNDIDIIAEIIITIREKLKYILGEKVDINVLQEIFKNFCIGK